MKPETTMDQIEKAIQALERSGDEAIKRMTKDELADVERQLTDQMTDDERVLWEQEKLQAMYEQMKGI